MMKPYCASKQAADLVDLGGLLFRGLTAQAVDGLNQLHHVAIGLEGSYAHKHSEHCQRFPWRPDRGGEWPTAPPASPSHLLAENAPTMDIFLQQWKLRLVR